MVPGAALSEALLVRDAVFWLPYEGADDILIVEDVPSVGRVVETVAVTVAVGILITLFADVCENETDGFSLASGGCFRATNFGCASLCLRSRLRNISA